MDDGLDVRVQPQVGFMEPRGLDGLIQVDLLTVDIEAGSLLEQFGDILGGDGPE